MHTPNLKSLGLPVPRYKGPYIKNLGVVTAILDLTESGFSQFFSFHAVCPSAAMQPFIQLSRLGGNKRQSISELGVLAARGPWQITGQTSMLYAIVLDFRFIASF